MVADWVEPLLRERDPVLAIREWARGRLEAGATRPDLLLELQQVRDELAAAGRDADEDAVLDVMDFLEGWASPHMKL